MLYFCDEVWNFFFRLVQFFFFFFFFGDFELKNEAKFLVTLEIFLAFRSVIDYCHEGE